MIYWPLSTIEHSPLLAGPYALELRHTRKDCISAQCAQACFQVASYTPAIELRPVQMVENVGISNYWIFTEFPNFDDWMKLERAGITIRADGQPMLIFTPLH